MKIILFIIFPIVITMMLRQFSFRRLIGSNFSSRIFITDFLAQDKSVTSNIDVVMLGDSKAKIGFNPIFLSKNAFNLALGGGLPIESMYIINTFLQRPNSLKLAFLSFVPEHLDGHRLFMDQTIASGILPFQNIIDAEAYKYDKNIYTSNRYTGRLKFWAELTALTSGIHRAYQVPYRNILFNRKLGNIEKDVSDQFTGKGYNPQKDTFSKVVDSNIKKNILFKFKNIFGKYYLRETIKILVKNKIKVIFVHAPFSDFTKEHFQEKIMYKDFWFFLSELSSEFPSVIFEKEYTYYPNILFSDGGHLNIEGAKRWSRELRTKYLPN